MQYNIHLPYYNETFYMGTDLESAEELKERTRKHTETLSRAVGKGPTITK